MRGIGEEGYWKEIGEEAGYLREKKAIGDELEEKLDLR